MYYVCVYIYIYIYLCMIYRPILYIHNMYRTPTFRTRRRSGLLLLLLLLVLVLVLVLVLSLSLVLLLLCTCTCDYPRLFALAPRDKQETKFFRCLFPSGLLDFEQLSLKIWP